MTSVRLSALIFAFSLSTAAGTPSRMLAAPTASPKTSAPRIHFVAPVFDFGRIGAGNVVKHDYFFANAGTAPLVVTEVLPSCDCTTVGPWTFRVDAGKTGLIPVQFDSAGYGGAIDKKIMVASNDPAQPGVLLELRGTVSNPIEVSPPNAVFTPAAGATASETKIVRITNHTGAPLTLAAPESGNRAFAIALTTMRPGREFELRVTAVPPFRAGRTLGLITIKTDSAQEPVLAVTALAVVRPAVTASPPEPVSPPTLGSAPSSAPSR